MSNNIENMSPSEIDKNAKKCGIIGIIILIIVTIFIVNMCSDDDIETQVVETYTPQPTPPDEIVGSKEWKAKQIKYLKEDSIDISQTDYLSKSKGTNAEMDDAIKHLQNLAEWGSTSSGTQEEFYKNDKRANIPLKYIKKKAKSVLNRVLSEYRKSFAKNLAKAVWENDIYVTTSGGQNNVLNITGGTFAANANISDFQNVINQDVYNFGFKEVRYRWYKGADEYTSYKYK